MTTIKQRLKVLLQQINANVAEQQCLFSDDASVAHGDDADADTEYYDALCEELGIVEDSCDFCFALKDVSIRSKSTDTHKLDVTVEPVSLLWEHSSYLKLRDQQCLLLSLSTATVTFLW